ncbi:MAG: glycosyltransferase family 2 protein [Bacteroidales bacterium]|nr:glycosyltransferase family 2 protein [Bacteroidales bacterium]
MINSNIYIVIVTYNGERFIQKCLNSIRENKVACQIIVIDNNSTDKTTQIIKTDFSEVRLIEEKNNLGFGKANNIGLKIALEENADFVFLLNQDATIEKDSLEKFYLASKTYPEYDILSAIHLNGTKKELDYNFSKYLSPDMCPKIISDMILGYTKPVYTCDFINAAAWFMPIATLKNIGLFDPLFFHYGEDDDYVTRLKYHGGKVGVITNTSIVHDRPQKKTDAFNYNYMRKLTINFLKLKNMKSSFSFSVFAFTFHSSLKFITLLLSMKLKELFFSVKIFWKTIYLLPKIRNSRKESIKGKSFIDRM